MVDTKTKVRLADIEGFPLPSSDLAGQSILVDATGHLVISETTIGPKGDKGDTGEKPGHSWSDTVLTFENPDGTHGQSVDLRGFKGDTGEVGPQGLKGDKGDPGDILGPVGATDGNIVVFDGETGKAVKDSGVSPQGLQNTVDQLQVDTNNAITQLQLDTQSALDASDVALQEAISNANAAIAQAQRGYAVVETIPDEVTAFRKDVYLVSEDMSIPDGASVLVLPDVTAEVTGITISNTTQELDDVITDTTVTENAVFLPQLNTFADAVMTVAEGITLYGSDSRIQVY